MKKLFLAQIDNELRNIYEVFRNRKLIIYGGGGYGKRVIRLLIKYNLKSNIVAICDSDSGKWNTEIEGIRVCSIQDIDFSERLLAIIASECKNEIYDILKQYPVDIYKEMPYQKFMEDKMSMYVFKKENVNTVGFNLNWFDEWKNLYMQQELKTIDILDDTKSKMIIRNRVDFYCSGNINYIYNISVDNEEYFDKEILELTDEEVFVDCGAYTGDTILSFLKCVNDYKKIYAFEPDDYNFSKLKKEFGNREDILLYNCGVGEEDTKLAFSQNENMWSCVDENAESKIEIHRLDDIVQEKVTMIKMDIEGSELSALKGAEMIIKRDKPKLAICIYHKLEDIITIPVYIKSIVPDYRFYIRQYDDTLYQTVLYAVM